MAFTAKQVQRILQRATEVERTELRAAESPSLTAAEVQALGVEAGLSEASMQQALRELEAPATVGRLTETAAHFRTALFPARLNQAMGDALLTQLRLQFGGPGTVYHIGDGFEWHGTHKDSLVVCSVRPEGNQVRVSLQVGNKRLLPESGDLWIPLLGLTAIAGLASFIDVGASFVAFFFLSGAVFMAAIFATLYIHDTLATRPAERSLTAAFDSLNALLLSGQRPGDV